jgi:uncharacterized spore protein YtfJ
MKPWFAVLLFSLVCATICVPQETPFDHSAMILKQSFEMINPNQAIGSPIQIGETVIIPLFQLSGGFGGGAGGDGSALYGSGVGGGLSFTPYAIITITKGELKVVPVRSTISMIEQLLNGIPKILPLLIPLFNGY